MEAAYGALQHELLMAIILENLYESGRLCPPAKPPVPIGQPLHAPGKQTESLGVDHSKAPRWRVAVSVPVIQVAVESLPVLTSVPGYGPPLAEVIILPGCLWFCFIAISVLGRYMPADALVTTRCPKHCVCEWINLVVLFVEVSVACGARCGQIYCPAPCLTSCLSTKAIAVQVLMYALHIEVVSHTCGSLGIIVCSDSLDIWDTSKGPKPPGSGQKEPAVISIGQQHAAQGSLPQSLHHVNSLHLAKLDEGSVGRQKVHTTPMLI